MLVFVHNQFSTGNMAKKLIEVINYNSNLMCFRKYITSIVSPSVEMYVHQTHHLTKIQQNLLVLN
jgi:hypothetical protein